MHIKLLLYYWGRRIYVYVTRIQNIQNRNIRLWNAYLLIEKNNTWRSRSFDADNDDVIQVTAIYKSPRDCSVNNGLDNVIYKNSVSRKVNLFPQMLLDKSTYMIQEYSFWNSRYEIGISEQTRKEPTTCCTYNVRRDGFGEKCTSEIFENYDK